MALSPTSSRGATSSGAVTLLDTKAGDGTSGTFTFSAISGSYKHLGLVMICRGDAAATATNLALTFNGAGGTAYDQNYFAWDGSTTGFNPVFGAASNATALATAAGTATANYVGMWEFFMPYYADTTFFKIYRGLVFYEVSAASAGIPSRVMQGTYKSTSAITSLSVALSSGNLITGSKASLYGYS